MNNPEIMIVENADKNAWMAENDMEITNTNISPPIVASGIGRWNGGVGALGRVGGGKLVSINTLYKIAPNVVFVASILTV